MQQLLMQQPIQTALDAAAGEASSTMDVEAEAPQVVPDTALSENDTASVQPELEPDSRLRTTSKTVSEASSERNVRPRIDTN